MPSGPGVQPASSSSLRAAAGSNFREVGGGFRVVVEHGGVEHAVGGGGGAEPDGLGDGVAVGGHDHCAAEGGVVDGGFVDLEADEVVPEVVGLVREGDAGGVAQGGEGDGGDILGGVALAGLEGGEDCVGVGDDAPDHAVDLGGRVLEDGRAPVVAVVLLEHEFLPGGPGDPAEWAGAVEALDAEIGAELFDAVFVDDREEEQAELEGQFVEGGGEFVFDGEGVGRADVLDGAGAPADGGVGGGVDEALDGVDDVVGGHLAAAAEGDVVAEVEGVELAVGADVPGFGEAGADGFHVPIEGGEGVGEEGEAFAGGAGGGAGRVVIVAVDGAEQDEGAGGRGLGGGG